MELNKKQLSEVMDLSIRQIDNLRNNGIIEHIPGTKKYNLAKCVQEYIRYKINHQSGSAVDKEREQAEHERLKKELTQLKLRQRRGELIETKYAEEFYSNILFGFKEKLLSIPGKTAPELIGENDVNRIMKILNREILDALEALSGYDLEKAENNSPNSDEDDEDDEDK